MYLGLEIINQVSQIIDLKVRLGGRGTVPRKGLERGDSDSVGYYGGGGLDMHVER